MVTTLENDQAYLIERSRRGDHEAFGQLVHRYQALICGIAYSATGSLAQSEDLAQDVFVIAWQKLGDLEEPTKLRAWLCGIARNLILNANRKRAREPISRAETLEGFDRALVTQPSPAEHAVTREEESILWRALEQVPETYREPMVLFYRQHRSIEQVAEVLGLSEDAVRQRLTRGRKILHEEMLTFVENTLERTNPGQAFTSGVIHALPLMATATKAAAIGATAAKGTAGVKAAGGMAIASAVLSPLLTVVGYWTSYRLGMDSARSDRERAMVQSLYRGIMISMLSLLLVFGSLLLWGKGLAEFHPTAFATIVIGATALYMASALGIMVRSIRHRRELARQKMDGDISEAREYKSAWRFLGLPLVHVRIGRGLKAQGAVRGWIAVGDTAIGGLFAYGGMAAAPIAIGGCACGLVAFGGFAVGVISLGGFAVGTWVFSGLGVGWEVFAGCAVAWKAAAGAVALGYDFALGYIAQAAGHLNDEAAKTFMESNMFFRAAQKVADHAVWFNLLWVLPLIGWGRAVRNQAKNGG